MAGTIKADQRDFRASFQKHYHTYVNSIEDSNKTSEISRILMLVYCVESGLKCMLMKKARVFSVDKAGGELEGLLRTHDFELLLTRLPKAGYRFPPFTTKHGDTVMPKKYHQICRYAIPSEATDIIKQYNNQLKAIAEWLSEKV